MGRKVAEMDIQEIIRQIQAGETNRKIGRRLHMSKTTVGRYRALLEEKQMLSENYIPTEEVMKDLIMERKKETTGPVSSVEPYRETVTKLLEAQVSMTVILQRLRELHGYKGGYSSVVRFVRTLEKRQPEVFVRMEVAPGSQAQVDFGYAGRIWDPILKRLRKTWAFVMVLSHSRHQFARFVFEQTVSTWLALHRQAFEYFDGVAAEVVLDNLKSAILRASVYDPLVQRSYRECALHYGFLISPCRPNTPEHKGKVEAGGVRYVKKNFLAGRTFRDIDDANEQLMHWCLETAGKRIHGTTRQVPMEVFLMREKQALLPLPADPYQLAIWKECTLHPDGYVVFEQSYYTAPYHLVGKKLSVRATEDIVQIFHEHQLMRTHTRVTRKGERKTHPDDVPPEKMAFFLNTPVYCRQQAQKIGPGTYEAVTRLLDDRPLNHLRAVQGILRLKKTFGTQRLEAACNRALKYNALSYGSIHRILVHNYDTDQLPGMDPQPTKRPSKPPIFARDWTELFSNINTTSLQHGDKAHENDTQSGTDVTLPAPERDNGHNGDTHSGSN